MIMIVTFVGTWIHIYSMGYMAHDKGYHRYFGYLNLFTGSMLILVLAANLPVMFIGWEGVGLCSFLLIGFWYENDAYAYAGRKAFVVNRIGDFMFLLGMFLLYWAVKSLDFNDIKNVANIDGAPRSGVGPARLATSGPTSGSPPRPASACSVGACGKSAQLPLFVWLPDAMAGPTPVSALIHAATMVTAGVYMVCRLSFLYSISTTAMIVISTVGLLTALVAAFIAFAQNDLKKVLAYSTVSQLGFMFVAAGTGNYTAAIFHLGTHAFFKACLFLGAGSVMHGMEHGGSTTPGDITTMGGLRKHMPITRATFLISCLAISGIFPFAGFFSKDEILGGAWAVAGHGTPPGWPQFYGYILWGGLLIAALGTAFYMWRLYFLVFSGNERSEAAKHAHESPASMTSALAILALFATIDRLHRRAAPRGAPRHPVGVPRAVELARAVDPARVDHRCDPHRADRRRRQRHHDDHPDGGRARRRHVRHRASRGRCTAAARRRASRSGSTVRSPDRTRRRSTSCGSTRFYDATIVRPFKMLARGLFEIADRFIIDTVAVNGAAFIVSLFGRLSRWFQNGQVQRYVAGLVIGAARGVPRHRLPPPSGVLDHAPRRAAPAPRRAGRGHRRSERQAALAHRRLDGLLAPKKTNPVIRRI